jgi:hypothetical protein
MGPRRAICEISPDGLTSMKAPDGPPYGLVGEPGQPATNCVPAHGSPKPSRDTSWLRLESPHDARRHELRPPDQKEEGTGPLPSSPPALVRNLEEWFRVELT